MEESGRGMVNFTKSQMNKFTYKDWNDYFSRNNEHRLNIDFSQEDHLNEKEISLILPSIREFQKGEGSDGRYLLEAAGQFADKEGLQEYTEAMRWFVKEENWHSAYLRKFMDFYHIKVKEKSLFDKVFRRLRKLGGIKCEVTVLVTAEMIALTYYDALAESTASPALKSICAQMLHDEIPHIMFQSYTLSHFKNSLTDKMLRIMLMEITLLFVWGAFHDVYRAGGYGFKRYLKENMGYLRQSVWLADKNNKAIN